MTDALIEFAAAPRRIVGPGPHDSADRKDQRMRIAHLDLPDDLATAVGDLSPDATWSEMVEHALTLVIADARAADTTTAVRPSTVIDMTDPAVGIAAAIRWAATR